MANDIKRLVIPLAAYTGAAVVPGVYLSDNNGGVTVKTAYLTGDAAGTSITGQLITLADAGTPTVNGTVGAFAGTVVYAAAARFACTLSSAWVDDGRWLGFSQASGTAPANAQLVIEYVDGR